MHIKLKHLTLSNFKGIKNLQIDFSDDVWIFGDNGAGKTTLVDSFTWLLFGKDSTDRKDFEIKTLDENNNPVPKIEHTVEAIIEIDGKDTTFKRTLREKWVTKRGSEETVFEGNETICAIDDVPLKIGEYQKRISDIIDEQIFKLITSPTAFNALKWQDRRAILIKMAGGIEQDEIIEGMDASADQKQTLLNLLAKDSTLADQKRAIAAKVKQLKDEIKLIPARIDEVERSKPNLEGVDFVAIEERIQETEKEIANVEEQITDKTKALDAVHYQINDRKKGQQACREEMQKIEAFITNAAREQRENNMPPNIAGIENRRDAALGKIDFYNQKIQEVEKMMEEKRKQWEEENANTFEVDPDAMFCPTCKQSLEGKTAADKELKMASDFNRNKQIILDGINVEGKRLKDMKEDYERHLKEYTNIREAAIKELEEAKGKKGETRPIQQIYDEELAKHPEHGELKKKIEKLEEEIQELKKQTADPKTDNLKEWKQTLQGNLSTLNAQLNQRNAVKRADIRITELKDQEQTFAKEIAAVERNLFLIDRFNKESIEAMEAKISGMFNVVRFKMFEQQINGGETETCICMVNGVPFSDLNHAMTINAGMDIINALSDHYNVFAPIFIDGRESIVDLVDTESQTINLVVSPGDTELRIL